MSTADASTGMPAGPAGCGSGCFVLLVVAVLVLLFIASVWWMLRDIGAA